MRQRLVVVLLVLSVIACGGDGRDLVVDCRGGPAGGSAIPVEDVIEADLQDCAGGFGVRGHAFGENGRLTLCADVAGDPPRCVEPSISAATEGEVPEVAPGAVVDAHLVYEDEGLRVANIGD